MKLRIEPRAAFFSARGGFTLIELMIVVAVIATIASVAVPKFLSTRLGANESAAASTLRTIASAQAQIQSANYIDTDSDGGGEYAFFGELAGTHLVREDAGGGNPQVSLFLMAPSMLSTAFGNMVAGGSGGVVVRSGYIFQMWLPGPGDEPAGVAEAEDGGMDEPTGPANCEILWACYAWPLQRTITGNRAFFVNQDGDILQYNNKGATLYDGLDGGPVATAAYSGAHMASLAANAADGIDAQDGNNWTVLQ